VFSPADAAAAAGPSPGILPNFARVVQCCHRCQGAIPYRYSSVLDADMQKQIECEDFKKEVVSTRGILGVTAKRGRR